LEEELLEDGEAVVCVAELLVDSDLEDEEVEVVLLLVELDAANVQM
jgi:hypothetical protein